MARVLNRTLILALVMELVATVPTIAVEPPPEHAPSSAEPPLRVAPFGSERTRPAQPGRQNGLLPPDVWVFELRYLGVGVVQLGVDPKISTTPPDPDPVELHIPRGYSPILDRTQVSYGFGVRLLVSYPSFKPSTCDKIRCGDEVSAVFGLEPDRPARATMGSLRSDIEAGWWVKEKGRTLQAVPVPPGFEEAFIVEDSATSPGERMSTKFLAYRDERGELQDGHCDLKAANLECEFETSVPGTHIAMTYSVPVTLLPQRQTIENGLHALVSGWLVGAR